MEKKEYHDNIFNLDIESFLEGKCKLNIVTKKREVKSKGKEKKEEITKDYILVHPDQYNSLAPFVNFSKKKAEYQFDFSYIKIRKEGQEKKVEENTAMIREFLNKLGFTEKKEIEN